MPRRTTGRGADYDAYSSSGVKLADQNRRRRPESLRVTSPDAAGVGDSGSSVGTTAGDDPNWPAFSPLPSAEPRPATATGIPHGAAGRTGAAAQFSRQAVDAVFGMVGRPRTALAGVSASSSPTPEPRAVKGPIPVGHSPQMAPLLRQTAAGVSDALDAYMVTIQRTVGEEPLPTVSGSEGTPRAPTTVQAAAHPPTSPAATSPPAAVSQTLPTAAAAVASPWSLTRPPALPGTAAAATSPLPAKIAAIPGAQAAAAAVVPAPPQLPAAGGVAAPKESLPSPRERGRPPRTPRPKAGSLEASQPVDVYEALKLQQPAEVQQQIELEEMFWDARELEERRKDLQQRLKDEEMLERIRRRVAGEKITLPSLPIPKVITKLLTPRGTPPGGGTARTPRSARSNQSQPLSVRSERSALLPPPPPGEEDATEAAAGGNTSVAGGASRKGSALSPAAAAASGGSNTSLGSFPGEAPSMTRGSKVGPGVRGSRVGKGSAIYTTDARASWFEYYHRPSVAPQAPKWRLRLQQGLETVVHHPDFGLAVTLLIAVNCIALALYQPQLPDTEGRNQVLKVMEMTINFAFTLEVVLVCIAAGGPKEYLRSPWNIFDFTMVLVGYTDFIPTGSNQAGGVRALRALRALRPLRTITRFESLRSIVVCFLEAVPLLISVVQLLIFFTVLAAITGTLLFMDSFHQACFDNMTGVQETNDGGIYDYGCGSRDCPANFTCLAYEPEPPLSSAGFGNVGESMLSTFQVITMSSWAFIMYIVMDNSGVASFLFFLAIVLLQSYFVINLFLAVLKNKFAKAQELYSKVAVEDESKQRSTFSALWRALTERWRRHKERRMEQDNLKMSERSSRPTTGFSTPTTIRAHAEEQHLRRPSLAIPQTRWQWALYYSGQYWFEFRWHVRQVVEHPGFDYAFLACIVANTALLAMTKADMSPGYAATLEQGSRALTFVFLLEAATKLVGLGPWTYMSDPFNNFDFIIVLLGLVELIISMGSSGTALRSFRTLRILRSLRVLRVLKVFRYLQSLRVITNVLLSSLGAFLAIAGLMTLFIFVFAVIGLQTFGHYDLEPDYPNFHNVWNAIVLVFQTLTLENWAQVMFSVQASAGWASALFFVVWVALGKWTLLTLFLAITLSAFEANYEKYNTRGGSGGGISWLVGWLKGLKQSVARSIRRYRRRRRIAPTSSFNSSSSLTSADSATDPPPGASKRFKRSLTVMLKETALAALSPATTSSDESEVPLPTASKRPSQQVQGSKQSFMAGLFTRKQAPSQGDGGLAPDAAAAAAAPGAAAGSAAPSGGVDGTSDIRLKAHVPGKDAASAAVAATATAAQNRLSALSQLELEQKQLQQGQQAGAKAGLLLSPGPPDVLLSLPAGSASDGCEALSAAAVTVLPKPPTQAAAFGTPLQSPADLLLNVGTLSDEQEPPQQPQPALVGAAAGSAQLTTPLGQRGLSPANVILTVGGGTDDSEVSFSPQQQQRGAASPLPQGHGQQRPRPRPPQLATAQRPTQRQEHAQQQKEQQRQQKPARPGLVSATHRPAGQAAPAKGAASGALEAGPTPAAGAEGSPHKAPTLQVQQHPGRNTSTPPPAQRVASDAAEAEAAADGGAALPAPLQIPGASEPAAVATGHVSSLVERFEAFSPTAVQAASPPPKRQSLVSPPVEARRVLRRVSSAPLTASQPALARVGSCLGDVEEIEGEVDDDNDAASVKSEGDATSLEAAAGDSPSPPKRKRAKSRHARFADIPDDEDDAAEGSGSGVAAQLLPRGAAGSSSLSPSASGKLAGERRPSVMRSLTPHARRQPPPLGALRHSGSSSGLGSSQETYSFEDGEEGMDDSHHDGGSDSDAAGDPRRKLGGSGRFGSGKFGGSGRLGSGRFGSGRLGRLGSGAGGGSFGGHKRTPSDTSAPSDLLEEAAHESEASMGSMHSAGSGITSGVGSRTGSQISKLSRLATLGSRLNSSLATKGGKRSKRKDYPQLTGSSLWYFKEDNRLRSAAYYLVTLQNFDYAMMVVVLLSCVQMAMETPNMDPAATRTIILRWIDIGTTVIFWIEALLKIFAFSFHLYIQYFTNKVDFGVVVISTVVLIAESLNARFLKAFRALRAIKPLRVLTRSVSMLLVFHTLTRSLMAMGNVTVLCALCFLIFAILGVQLFAGLLWSCTDPNVAGKADCVGSFIDDTGQLAPREWVNQPYHFDNVGNAFLTLFITATLDGYTPAMYMSMDARSEPGLQPLPGSNPAAFLFWFAYITLVAFFVLNLYVGVVFYQFQRLKMLSQTGSAVLTASQTGYVEMMKAVFRLKPLDKAPLPPNLLRRLCHKLAYNYWFDKAMTATIVANILLLATTYYGESAGFAAAKEHANTAFSVLVILECFVKLIAMGPKLYWRSSWNKFDLLLTVAALVDLLTQLLNALLGNVVDLSTIKKTMMLLRTLRMFKLMRKFRGIQSLMTTLIISLPAIVNVGALLLLFFFIYSYMGVLLLGNIKLQQHLNSHANFLNFPNAMLLLFRVATGDDWAGIMADCMVGPPDCNPHLGECGSKYVWVYFLTFYLAVGLIALNLFTTVILETFERIQDTEAWKITPANLDEFCELWAEYDDGTSLIEPKDLEQILMRLKPPMGLGAKANGTDVVRFVFALDIPLVDGKVPFYRTAFELVKKGAQAEIPQGELKSKLDRMIRRFLNKHGAEVPENDMMSFSVACTVVRIQRHWRGLVAKRKEEAAIEAAKAARRAAGLPSEEDLTVVEEQVEVPQQATGGSSFRRAMRRASTVLASLRQSMQPSSKQRASTRLGADGGLAALDARRGSGQVLRPSRAVAVAAGPGVKTASPFGLASRLSRASVAAVTGAARRSLSVFAPLQEQQGSPLHQKQQQPQLQAIWYAQALPGNAEPSQGGKVVRRLLSRYLRPAALRTTVEKG